MADNSDLVGCIKCDSVFEMPARYIIDLPPGQAVKKDGLCFSHLQSKDDRRSVLDERKSYLRNKYHVFTTLSQGVLNQYRDISSRYDSRYPAFFLEKAIAEFTFETGRDEAPFAIIGRADSSDMLESTRIQKILEFYRKDFPETFASVEFDITGRLVILARTNDIIGFAERTVTKVESAPRSCPPYFAIASSFSCHKKRENFGEYVNGLFVSGLEELEKLPREDQLRKVVGF